MTMIIWDAKAGKVISFLYDSGKDKKMVILKNPIKIDDKKTIDEIDRAVGIVARHVANISCYNEYNCNKGINREFLNVNNENIMERTIDILQSDILREVLIHFMHEGNNRRHGWIGTMSELYGLLYTRLENLGAREQFPKSHIALGKRINAIIVNLEASGIVVERYRDRRGPTVNYGKVERLVRIRMLNMRG